MHKKELDKNRKVYSSDSSAESFDYRLYGEGSERQTVTILDMIVRNLTLKIISNMLLGKKK